MTQLPEGIIVPLPTPLHSFDRLDVEGLNNLIEHVIAAGVSGISILGHTGEERCLDYKMRQIVISETCSIVDGRTPIFLSISDTSITESYMLANFAATCGVTAMVFSPPYYLTTGQAELVDFYEELLKIIPLPIILYNIESPGQIKIDPQTIMNLLEHPLVVGLKDSSADIIYLNRIIDDVKNLNKDFKVYSGKEEVMFESVLLGCHGCFAGGANLFPELYIELYNAARSNDLSRCLELQSVVMEINKTIYSVGHYHSSYLKGIKCALSLMGIIGDDYMAPPFHKFNIPEREKIKMFLSKVLDNNIWMRKN